MFSAFRRLKLFAAPRLSCHSPSNASMATLTLKRTHKAVSMNLKLTLLARADASKYFGSDFGLVLFGTL